MTLRKTRRPARQCYSRWLAFAFLFVGYAGIPMSSGAEGLLNLSKQGEQIRAWVDYALETEVAPWDEAAAMAGSGKTHSSRGTMLYAAGLLLRNQPGDAERAHRAIRSVLALQYDMPERDWHGTYKRNELEPEPPKPGMQWKDYDPNWREFIGTAQIIVLKGCPDRLEPALRESLLAALRRACEGAHARRVSWRYTNIALMSAYLLSWGGRQFENDAWEAHGRELAGEIHREFMRENAFQEYNSPTYSGTDLYALGLWRALPVFPEMATMAREMEDGLWRDLARRYHAGLKNLCGPFDRSYGMDMRKYLAKSSICIALALNAPECLPDLAHLEHHRFEMGFAPLMAALGMRMPEDAAAHFRTFKGSRRFEQIIERGLRPRAAQAWLEPDFMVGAEQTDGAGYQNSQAHLFTLHWKAPNGEVGWLRMLQNTLVEARIEDHDVVFSCTRKYIPEKSQSLEFEVYSPGATPASFTQKAWTLPGMPLAVKTNLPAPAVSENNGLFRLRYVLSDLQPSQTCLTLHITAP